MVKVSAEGTKLNDNVICDADSCTACTACVNVCPQHCILMKEDIYGELHPYIDEGKCVHCGLCKKCCPNLNNRSLHDPLECYAGWRNDKTKRMSSSSGGIAAFFAEQFIKNGDVVYGVVYEHEKGAYYKRAETMVEIDQFKGSKYVQADVGNTFLYVLNDLRKGKKVLFLGLPCLISGMLSYFSSSTEKRSLAKELYAIDFLCHGTIPNKYLLEELSDLEQHFGFRCDKIFFRSNERNKNYYLSIEQNGCNKYRVKADKQRYFYGFLKSIYTRESCVNCKYKQLSRIGDITLGDFIGLAQKTPIDATWEEMMNPSVVFVNTEKGKRLIQYFSRENGEKYVEREYLVLIKRSVSEAVQQGPSLRGGAEPSNLRIKFRSLYPKYGFVKAANRTVSIAMKADLIKNQLTILCNRIRRAIKKIVRIVIRR